MTRERYDWIDWSKALLIWMMVLGHTGISGYCREFIYAFHMPAFFIISGYLYKSHNCFKMLKIYGIPVFIFSIINLLYYVVVMILKNQTFDIIGLLSNCYQAYYKCNLGDYITLFRGVWFIVVLFFMRMLLGDIKIFTVFRRYYKFIFCMLLLYMVIDPFIINEYPYLKYLYIYKVLSCMPFVMFGIFLKESGEKLLQLNNKLLFVMAIIYVGLTLYNGNVDIWNYEFGRSYFIFFVNAIISSLLLFNLCMNFSRNKIVTYFSIGTIVILGLHDIILNICYKIFGIIDMPTLNLLSSLVVMFVCYFVIRLILKYCPIVLGK